MPTETIGRYEIGSIIGRGAMAVVYKGVDPTIGRTVALKTMRLDIHGMEKNEVLSRFRNEARAAGNLIHPNLVTIYDAGEQDGTFYIAMEYVEGSTLQALLAEQRFLTLDRTVDILTQICSGLDYAHEHGVVHRDIKPANIMITRSGVVKIMDFGIAKSGAQLTTAGDVLGTPNYISPEMVKGDPIDGRTDLFSVAVILHEMLLGERPFVAANINTIVYKIVNEPLSPDLETKVHPAVAAILRKSLSKHPSDRYQSGLDLVNALKAYQAMLTHPIPPDVVPGTDWPTSSPATNGTAAAAAPKLAPVVPISKSPLPPPAYAPPEVFGVDVPDEFRNFSAPIAPEAAPGPAASAPPSNLTPTPPPAPKSMGKVTSIGVKSSALPPRVVIPEPPAPEKPGFGLTHILLLAAIAVVIVIVVVVVVLIPRSKTTQPVFRSGISAVATPDPAAITQSESAKDPEPTSKIEPEADPEITPDKSADPVAAKAKAHKPEPAKAPVAAASPEAAPAATTADLTIASNPDGASVQLDGQNRSEKTPFTVSALAPGLHTLIFTKPGYTAVARTIDLAAGANPALSVNLVAAATAIAFESNPPGAAISIDEEPTGQVTPATLNLAPGAYAISLAKAGFEEATGSVHLNQGESQHFSAVLQSADRETRIRHVFNGAKDKAMIVVRSRPRGAHITLDDRNVEAATPARLIVRTGKAHLTVEREGYKPFHRDVQVGKGDIVIIDALLEPQS